MSAMRTKPHIRLASLLPVLLLLAVLKTGYATRHLRGQGLPQGTNSTSAPTSAGGALPLGTSSGGPDAGGIPVFPGLNDTSSNVTVVPPNSSGSTDAPTPLDPCLSVLNGTLASLLNSTLLTNASGLTNGSHVVLLNSTVLGSNVTGGLLLLNASGAAAWLNSSIAGTAVGDLLNCTRARNCSLTWGQVLNSTLLELCSQHTDPGSSSSGNASPPGGNSSGEGPTPPQTGSSSSGHGSSGAPGPHAPINSCPGCTVEQWDQYCAATGYGIGDPACDPIEFMCKCFTNCAPGAPGRIEPMYAPDYVGCATGWVRVTEDP